MNQTTPAKLERRARALMRAYPAEYRHDRAEEIIDTLLEATPRGLAYPTARDSWSLIAGGLRARATRNRAQGAAASLRLALLLGTALFLSFSIDYVLAMPEPGVKTSGLPWPAIAACVLSTAAGLAPWLLNRSATAALAIPAGVLLAIEFGVPYRFALTHSDTQWLAWILVALALLVALSGSPSRLPGSWLWLLGVAPATAVAARLTRSSALDLGGANADVYLIGYAALLLAVVVTGWLVTDARPAFGLSVAVLLTLLQYDTSILLTGYGLPAYALVMLVLLPLAVSVAITLGVLRLLYRHPAPAPRPLR